MKAALPVLRRGKVIRIEATGALPADIRVIKIEAKAATKAVRAAVTRADKIEVKAATRAAVKIGRAHV